MTRLFGSFSHQHTSAATRILFIVLLAVLAHVLVRVVGRGSAWLVNKTHEQKDRLGFVAEQPKIITVLRLVANTLTWVVYFFAVGLILEECGVNLTAYLASASVVALAISFGSQGLVQDMVIGVTLIFSDAMDVGDMVEITGTVAVVGRVEEIGLRFTKLLNLYNQVVFIPNRTIANVSRFPHGGVYAYADVQVPKGANREKAARTVELVAQGMWRQFGAIILEAPRIDSLEAAPELGWQFSRVHFKIWPGQGTLIETTFRQQIVAAMKAFDPNYADWQVAVTYRALTPAEAA